MRLARQPALFVCTHNSARSQLAAALWKVLAHAPAESAGTHPSARVHPGAVLAGRRAGLDLADAAPRPLADVTIGDQLVVTVCDRAHEELDPAPTWLHWSIDDPVATNSKSGVRPDGYRAPPADHLPDRRGVMTELAHQPETGTGTVGADLGRRLVAEALGTALLVVAVIGSGIMASRLSPDDVGLQLLENAAATAAALIGLILIFGAVSGAHFNPVVTLVDRANGDITTRDSAAYIAAQLVGGCLGAVDRQPHVRAAGDQHLRHRPLVRRPVVLRGDRHRRAAARHPRLRPQRPSRRRCLRRRPVDRRRLLVHLVDQLRQPRRHGGAHPFRHVCRHRPVIGADVHRDATRRRRRRLRPDSLPLPARRRRRPATDAPSQLGATTMPDLETLSIDQQYALEAGRHHPARRVRRLLLRRRPSSCTSKRATTSSPTGPSSPTSSR